MKDKKMIRRGTIYYADLDPVKGSEQGGYKELLAMVTEINANEVDKRDKLTDQVYHYDVTDKVFEKASRYEERKAEKSHDKKSVLEKLEEKKEEAKAFVGEKKIPRREAYSL